MPRLRRLRRLAASRLPIATKDQLRAAAAPADEWAKAYEQLLAAAEGREPRKAPTKIPAPSVVAKVRKATEQKAVEPLVKEIARGESLEDAVARRMRSLVSGRRVSEGQALADSLIRRPSTERCGHLAAGVLASVRQFHELALHHFDSVDESTLIETAPRELVRSLFEVDRTRGVESARRWLAADAPFTARDWFELYRNTFVSDELDLADELFAKVELEYEAPEQRRSWRGGADDIAWDRRWVGARRGRSAPTAPAGRVSFGLVDYVQPGRARASQNIGDQVQTLASLGHVVRHQNLRFHGDDDVVAFVEEMRDRVRPELRLDGVSADVELMTVDRDSSTYQEVPPETWLIEFGWHMHALFGLDIYDFPLHPNLNPIFVSFHCNKRELLTPESLDYLREHGPIGCRDWTTVDLLLSLDVPAFFSGCLTTTVNTVFPDIDRKPDPATVYVDVTRSTVPKGHENVRQSYGEIKKRTFTENMRDAVQLLERYRHEYTDVVTTRLHCYLPATSLGLNVHFEPKNNADVRFNGLFRLGRKDFDAMRSRMRDRLEPVLSAIFSGQDRESIYALWRRVVEPEVQAAKARHTKLVQLPKAEPSIPELLSRVQRPAADSSAETIDIVLVATGDQVPHLAPVLRSAAASTTRPIRAWVVSRTPRPEGLAVDDVDVHWVETTDIDSPSSGVLDARSLDRTLLADLLPVDRAVLVPVDAVITGDLAELADLDLGSDLFAARRTSRANSSGFAVLYGAARRLDAEPDTAYEFYTRIHATHMFDFDAFDTDVMVMNLAGLREEGYSRQVLPAMKRYRLDERAALHYFAGPRRTDLPAHWAHVPGREHVADPKLRHWAEPTKPWSALCVDGDEVWRKFAES